MADDSVADPDVEVRFRAFDKGDVQLDGDVEDCLSGDPAKLAAPIKTLKDKFELLGVPQGARPGAAAHRLVQLPHQRGD